MNDSELRLLIEAAYNLESDYQMIEGVLRPPATAQAIEECETLLGRRFSPSYKHFLSLHNGWEEFPCGMLLLGIEDYTAQAVRDEVAFRIKCELHGLEIVDSFDAFPDHIFWPENIHHFLDGNKPELSRWEEAAKLIHNYDEHKDYPLLARHLIIGVDFAAPMMMFFDKDTLDLQGEMEVVRKYSDGSMNRWKNFYEMLAWFGTEETISP